MEKGYLIGFAVVVLGCSARLWCGLERVRTSLRAVEKAKESYRKQQQR